MPYHAAEGKGEELMEHIPGQNKVSQIDNRLVKYAIGIEYSLNVYGMYWGPSLSIQDMLDQIGVENACIIRFNADWTDDVLWRWDKDRWVSVEQEEKT